MSIHGGEERWSLTLKNIYIKLENISNHIPGREQTRGKKRENNKRSERNICFQSHLSQCKHAR
jgi:hypothetical protein